MTVPCRLFIPLVVDALRQGSHASFTATGSSMRPFLHDGDQVEIEPLSTVEFHWPSTLPCRCGADTRVCRVGTHADAWRSVHRQTLSLESLHPPAPSNSPRLADIVLATDPAGNWRLHRVVRIQPEGIFLAGDAQHCAEGPFLPEHLVGRVVAVQRAGHTIHRNRYLWRALGLLWIRCAPLGQWLLHRLR